MQSGARWMQGLLGGPSSLAIHPKIKTVLTPYVHFDLEIAVAAILDYDFVVEPIYAVILAEKIDVNQSLVANLNARILP